MSTTDTAVPAPDNVTPKSATPSNLILWVAFAVASLLVGMRFIFSVHGRLSLDALLGIATLIARTALYVSGGMLIESLLLRARSGYWAATARRRVLLHVFWVLVMFATVGWVVDMLVFSFAGYHLLTALRILFSDGPANAGKVIEATGMSVKMLLSAAVAPVIGLSAAIFLSVKTRDWSLRWNVVVARRTALRAIVASFGLLALLEFASHYVRDPYLWEQEIRSVPMSFVIAKPDAALLSFRVSLRPPDVARTEPAAVALPADRGRPDIYLFVIESLRKDAGAPGVMPRFSDFASKAWTFERPVTTGNVTHYSWYGLFCSNYPVYFDVAKRDVRAQGSVPIALLRRLGYRIRLFATPDTAYQNLEAIVFGAHGGLLDEKFHPPERLPADRDRHVIDELVKDIGEQPVGGRFHLVALDSTHYDYAWDASFSPPFKPYAEGTSLVENYRADANARQLVENRYHNSAAWVDSLLGRFFDALQTAGRMDRSIVIITGDHGEAFWEHGVGTHGSDLGIEQLEVAMAMRFPGQAPRRIEGVFSLLDVMPTVLDAVGYASAGVRPFDGKPLQERLGESGGLRAKGEALTFQGWNERAFRFTLSLGEQQLYLELDRENPADARRLAIQDVSYGPEGLRLSAGGNPAAYRAFLNALPRVTEALPFLEFK